MHFASIVPSAAAARRAACAAVLLLAAVGGVQAQQAQSMEERLRAQLRITTSQLQQAQNELAALKAGQGPAAAPAKADELAAMKEELSRAKAQLAAERESRQKARDDSVQLKEQAEAALEKAGAQVAQYRNAYDELLKMARASEAERQRLASETSTQRTAIGQCEAKNAQLYAVGKEILQAYETMDVGTVLSARQPFAGAARVRLDEAAQQFGDKLYEGRFDARGTASAAAQ